MTFHLKPVSVRYVEAKDGPTGAAAAFASLESKLPTLKGKSFYGVSFGIGAPYRACVLVAEGDEQALAQFPIWEIPGGVYARARIRDWESHVDEITTGFERLAGSVQVDESRPFIEHYRSQAELLLYVPVR